MRERWEKKATDGDSAEGIGEAATPSSSPANSEPITGTREDPRQLTPAGALPNPDATELGGAAGGEGLPEEQPTPGPRSQEGGQTERKQRPSGSPRRGSSGVIWHAFITSRRALRRTRMAWHAYAWLLRQLAIRSATSTCKVQLRHNV